MEFGTILETAFDLDAAGTLDDEPSNALLLRLLYATVLEPDLVGQAVEFPPERVHVLEKNGSLRPLAGAPAPMAPPPPPPPVETVSPAPPAHAEPAGRENPAPPPSPPAPRATNDTTIRLNVSLLESLMTLAGELVLSRNQLNESLARQDQRGIRDGAQRISVVTSDLQEVVTQTRMQPIGNLLSKFPRLVRDLARELNKEVNLEIEGGDVEIDKTILEGLSDPLTHMIRNSVDHGVESPRVRVAAGKPAAGKVTLRCYHQAGLVVVEVADDGKGLDPAKVAASALAKGLATPDQLRNMPDREKMALIFLPGVSTAEKVSDVSGRGVGMDVVKTNLDRLGGKMEIDSTPGRGASFRIKLPLTLAIIPSLLVSDGGERFAIPQVNVGELIRIPAGQIGERTVKVGGAEVLILRDRLVPLVYLSDVLMTPRPELARAANVVLVNAGAFDYGLVVEELHDTAEIVVKPLGRHLKGMQEYAGATILGDGRVAVILDVAGLAARASLSSAKAAALSEKESGVAAAAQDVHSLLLFRNAPSEICALAIQHVCRIERIRPDQVQHLGGRRTMQYRGATLPLVALHDTAAVGELSDDQRWVVIVFERANRPMGLLAAEPLDLAEAALEIDTETLRQPGIVGSAVLKDRTILLLDIYELAAMARPESSPVEKAAAEVNTSSGNGPTVLLAEDSEFFRSQIRKLIEAIGCRVLVAGDGQEAWELLDRNAGEVEMLTTDIEMPRLDGLALTRQIRSDGRFQDLPIIALSSLAGEEDIARGLAAGVNEYQVKLDKDELQESIRKLLHKRAAGPAGTGHFAGR
jgi:two-component system, chemotaxis family, sensor kinase CheA